MKYQRLKDKRVVVVGGSSGIGFAVAEGALYGGASWVLIASSSQAKVDAAVQRLPQDMGKVEGRVLDAGGDEATIKAFFDDLPEFDHLVWTAGKAPKIGSGGPPDKAGMTDLYSIRVFGPFFASKYAPSKMPQNADSSITLTTASAIRKPQKGFVMGIAVSGSVERLAKGLAVELAPIRVNVVSVGLVATEIHNDAPPQHKELVERLMTQSRERLPVRHVADAEEAAETYLYAMKSAYVTGETLNCDGGYVLT